MTDSVPEKLGKYEIIGEVGRGGFAAVYKAVDTTLDRTVALKVLAPHLLWDPTFVQRFQREAKVAANLDHPHIVTIYEVGQIEGVYFIAMQFLAGRTLSQILKAEGPLPVSRVQAIIEQIASALDYAHARGFVHRDIKPSNVIVADDGQATLTDFGLVKAGEGTKLSTTGVVFGTPEYMSPEQAEGKVLDARSDVYSFGVVLFEILAGRAPFVADTTPAVMYKHVHEPPPLDELPSDLPQGVVAVLLKALAKKREERYQSAGEMAVALQQAVSRVVIEEVEAPPPVVAPPPEAPSPEAERVPAVPAPPPARPALPWRWVAGIGAVVVVVVGLVIALAPSAPLPGMVHVPAGEFIMGSDEGEGDEQPVHTVYLDAFYIDKYEVTNAQFAAFVSATGHETDAEQKGCGWIYDYDGDAWDCIQGVDWQHPFGPDTDLAAKDEHPVVQVSWNDAKAYCEWAGRRLPTEAEWEKAARGTDGRTYPWENDFDCHKGNFDDEQEIDDYVVSGGPNCDGYVRTAPVGSYSDGAGPYGALDMAGNVWEWVADWYGSDYYGRSPSQNPPGPDSGEYKVVHGGSWYGDGAFVRAAFRGWDPPGDAYFSVGFRCAR